MATNDTNSVPLGEAGTGAAYLLPGSQAISNIGNWIDDTAQERAKREALKRQQAAQTAAAWKQNQLNIKGGTLFQPEINKRAAKVMDMGMALQQSGVNPAIPSTDPQTQQLLKDYHDQRTSLLSDTDARDEIAKRAAENEKLLAGQPAGYFDPQSVQDYHDYISGKIPLSEITGKGLQMPELKKAFDLQPLVDKIPAVPIETTGTNPRTGVKTKMVLPNEKAHLQLATGMINNTPEVRADIASKAGMPFDQIGDETDPAVIKQQLDDHWKSAPNQPQLVQAGINSYSDPKYDQLITAKAKQMAYAAKVKQDYTSGIVNQLNNKVQKMDDKSWDFAYQNEQDRRERLGMDREKFADWKEKHQHEAGEFTLGNQYTNVPVIQTKTSLSTGQQGNSKVIAEPGASLYGVNLPSVKTVVRPAMITDTKTGKTYKNTSPLEVEVSQIQMVPVFKDLSDNDPRNGSEVSARQLKEIVSGKHPFATMKNITYQPYAYGIRTDRVTDPITKASHLSSGPIKFSYDALKGSNVKKINTSTFDQATEGLRALQTNEKFRKLSPQDQLEFIKQRYNLNLDQ